MPDERLLSDDGDVYEKNAFRDWERPRPHVTGYERDVGFLGPNIERDWDGSPKKARDWAGRPVTSKDGRQLYVPRLPVGRPGESLEGIILWTMWVAFLILIALVILGAWIVWRFANSAYYDIRDKQVSMATVGWSIPVILMLAGGIWYAANPRETYSTRATTTRSGQPEQAARVTTRRELPMGALSGYVGQLEDVGQLAHPINQVHVEIQQCRKGEACGTVRYGATGCVTTLTYQDREGDVFRFDETGASGQASTCQERSARIAPSGRDGWILSWVGLSEKARLTRVGEPPSDPPQAVSAVPPVDSASADGLAVRELWDALADRVPDHFCRPWFKRDDPEVFEAGALAAVNCEGVSPGIEDFALFTFPTEQALNTHFTKRIGSERPPIAASTAGACANGDRGWMTWEYGRVACWTDPPDELTETELRWTDTRANTYGVMSATYRSIGRLYRTWLRERP